MHQPNHYSKNAVITDYLSWKKPFSTGVRFLNQDFWPIADTKLWSIHLPYNSNRTGMHHFQIHEKSSESAMTQSRSASNGRCFQDLLDHLINKPPADVQHAHDERNVLHRPSNVAVMIAATRHWNRQSIQIPANDCLTWIIPGFTHIVVQSGLTSIISVR